MFLNELIRPFWRESIQFFHRESFKNFILATLNTFKRSLMLFFRYFWWMFFVIIAAQYAGLHLSLLLSLFLMSFLFILLVRPSIESKNFSYFIDYGKKIPGYLFIIFFFMLLMLALHQIIFLFLWLFGVSYFVNTLFLPLSPILIASFFFIDVENDMMHLVKSVVNSLKFCLYFFPVINALILFERLIFFCFGLSKGLIENAHSIEGMIIYTLVCIFAYLLMLLPFSALSVYYTTVKHNHHPLFF